MPPFSLPSFLSSRPKLSLSLSSFLSLLRANSPSRSLPRPVLCLGLLEVLKLLLSSERRASGRELLLLVEAVGGEVALISTDAALTNVVGRVMKSVRDEVEAAYAAAAAGAAADQRGGEGDGASNPPALARQPSLTSTLFPPPPPGSPELLYAAAETERLRSLSLGEAALEPEEGTAAEEGAAASPGSERRSQILPLPPHYSSTRPALSDLMESISEIHNDISTSHTALDDVAHLHLADQDTVLTYGESRTLTSFLRAASKKRSFQVLHAPVPGVYAGSPPSPSPHVSSLLAAGVPVTAIPASNVPPAASQSSVLLLSAHLVLANGGILAPAGSLLAATAAVSSRRPVVVVADLSYKLTRRYPHGGQDTLNSLLSPSPLLPPDFDPPKCLEAVRPARDYVPPEMLELLVTNLGTWKPSYVYRLLQDSFCEQDPAEFA